MTRTLKTLIILFATTVSLAGCASGSKIWSYNEETELQEGAKQHARILNQIGTYNNAKLSNYVDAVGQKIAAVSDRPKLQWHFTVLDSAAPNALATQGGYIYITRGMLALLQSEAELAAVLAHEIGHICAQDTPHKEVIGNIMGLGVLGMIVAAPELLLFPQIAAAPAGAGMAAISRKDELNADRLGTEYLQRAGFLPEAMQSAMDVLANMEAYERDRQKAAGNKPSTWWHRVYASHPTTEKRQEKLAERENVQNPQTATTSQPEFLARLDGLEFGSAKLEGIPYGHKRYFVQWNIALEIPDGWIGMTDYKGSELWVVRRDGKARIRIQRLTLTQIDQMCEWLIHWMKPVSMTESKPVHEYRYPSCAGIARESVPGFFSPREYVFRAGILAEGNTVGNGYLFRGYSEEATFVENDFIFLQMAKSLEILQTTDKKTRPPVLRIQMAKSGDTFSSLARDSRLRYNDAENVLRLLNRCYPNGEPQPGKLIEIIE